MKCNWTGGTGQGTTRGLLLFALAIVLTASAASAKDKKSTIPAPPDNYDEIYQQYLTQARSTPVPPTPGMLWMANLANDPRARNVNDLVTVHVVEAITAQGAADSALDKKSSGSAAVTSLFGMEKHFPKSIDPSNLAAINAATSFKGSGATSRSGSLSADMTARVSEVLPNGNLVVEGVREIEINGDRQIVVLTGIVRPSDIGSGNVVASTAIGEMRIRYFGRGLMKDNLQPGVLVRILNKIF